MQRLKEINARAKNVLPHGPGLARARASRLDGSIQRLAELAQDINALLELVAELRQSEVKLSGNFYQDVACFERTLIERALRQTGGSQRQAAALLGLKVSTLNSKIKRFQR